MKYLKKNWQVLILAFCLGVGLSSVANDVPPEDDQEDSANSEPCFTVRLDDSRMGFSYTEHPCEKEVTP